MRPAPSGTRLLLSDATAALDYDIAAEVLDNLDADIDPEDLEDAEPFEEGDLGLLSDIGLPEAVLGVILDETDLYADEQLGRIAREMGFADAAVGGDRPPRSVIEPADQRGRIAGTDEDLIRAALAVAATAGPRDVPIGAVVVGADGTELARAVNAREALGGSDRARRDPGAAGGGRRARATGGGWKGTTLAVTVEPCTMCAGALVLARVERLVFGAWEPKTGAVGSLWDVVRDRRLNHRPAVRGGVLAKECAAPLEAFFARQRLG